MKKKFILLAAIGSLSYLVLSSYSTGPASFGSLERTGVTGTVGCGGSSCHSTGATAGIATGIQLLSSGTPVTSYSPGGSYTIRLTGTNTTTGTLPYYGYQITAVKGTTTTNAGTMTAAAGGHLSTVSGVSIAEQSSSRPPFSGTGGTSTVYRVDIPWTAPAAGTGNVTLRGVINAVNGGGGPDAADKWNSSSATITESTGTAPITGTLKVCVGATTTLSDATTGGTWSSSATGIATVGASTGIVTGIAPGTSTISYAAGAGTVTAVVTVNPNPSAITGIPVVCPGGVTTLADATAGGTWSSSSTTVATVSASGVVTGVTSGSAIITYALSTGCYDTAALTVSTVPPITGTGTMCVGASTTLAHPISGGSWSSSTATIATVGASTGIVTGVAAGTSTITYAFGTSGCYVTQVVTVNGAPVAAVTGSSSVCVAHTITLTGSPAGGTWTSTNTARATVGASTGIVTGVATGLDTIIYKVTTVCGTDSTKKSITVTPASPCVSGVSNPFALTDEMKLYPNPNRGTFSLNVLATIDEEAHIIVTNIVGAKVREFDIRTNEMNNISIDQPAGTYFLSATTLNSKYFVKVVVE